MSHEIRTPMNAAIGYTELFEAWFQVASRNRTWRRSRRVAPLLTIINDILDLSKIESGKLRIEYAPVNPHRPLQDIVQIFRQNRPERPNCVPRLQRICRSRLF